MEIYVQSIDTCAMELSGSTLIDTTFNPPKFADPAVENGNVTVAALQTDGKILIGLSQNLNVNGTTVRTGIAGLNSDGSLDPAFNILSDSSSSFSGTISDIEVSADNKITFAGSFSYNLSGNGARENIARVLPDGAPDVSFNAQSAFSGRYISEIKLSSDDKVLVISRISETGYLDSLNADGSIDPLFNSTSFSGNSGIPYSIALQTDEKILIGGDFTSINFDANRKYLARLNSNGSLDTTFTPTPDNIISSLKIQPDGKILDGGAMNSVSGISRKSMVRLNQNGSVDPGFSVFLGADDYIWSIALQSDNNIIIVGSFRFVNGLQRIGVARLLNSTVQPRTPFDFDGDSRADISIFRPAAGEWWYLRSSDSSNHAFQFGSSSDRITPADFTGDGKTDVAFWRESSGE